MAKRKTAHVLRQKAWWVSSQTIFHCIAVLLVIGVFASEHSFRSASSFNEGANHSSTNSRYEEGHSAAEVNEFSSDLRDDEELGRKEDELLRVRGTAVKQFPTPSDGTSHGMEDISVIKDDPTMASDLQGTKKLEKPVTEVLPRSLSTSNAVSANAGSSNDLRAVENIRAFQEQGDEDTREVAIAEEKLISQPLANLSSDVGTNKSVNSAKPQLLTEDNSIGDSTKSGISFTGVIPNEENADLFKVDNITFLSHMLYKVVKTYDIKSLVDIPCTTSIRWMPELLQRLEFEVPKFHYRCIAPDDDTLVNAILRYKDISSAVVLKDSTFWASKFPRADLAFLWYGVGFMAPKDSWQLMKAITTSGSRFIAVPNCPNVKTNYATATDHGRVNIRRAPYLFDEAFRLIRDVGVDPANQKQLLLYKVGKIRGGVL